jgi:hypothetical protein
MSEVGQFRRANSPRNFVSLSVTRNSCPETPVPKLLHTFDVLWGNIENNAFSNAALAFHLPSDAFEPFDRIKVLVLA